MTTRQSDRIWTVGLALACAPGFLLACGDDVEPSSGGAEAAAGATGGDAGTSSDGGGAPATGPYVVGTMLFTDDSTTSYVSVLDSLEEQEFDFDDSLEIGGQADLWVHDGAVFVALAESLTIRRYDVRDGELVAGPSVSFATFGPTDFGFWRTKFVSPTKAYFLNGSSEYIVWNPKAMEITRVLNVPELPPEGLLEAFPGYSDRSAVVRDGRLYQPFYWTNDTYFEFAPHSALVVLDVETDTFEPVIEAPCPGLDHATVDDDGTIYFSPWIFAPGGAVVLDQPATCVAKLAPGSVEAETAFHFADVTGGREGAAMRYLGGGRALLSVFHDERFQLTPTSDVAAVTYGPNWRFWTYGLETGEGAPIESLDWNAGALYAFDVDGKTYLLVPGGDYSSTTVFDLAAGQPRALFQTGGWSTRLFAVR